MEKSRSGMEKFRSGINIPNPQHCPKDVIFLFGSLLRKQEDTGTEDSVP
jgi:hypothetical protein